MANYEFDPLVGTIILKPDGEGPGYWIGGHSLFFDKELNKFFLYTRSRNPRPTEGRVKPNDKHRGYRCQIHESIDGEHFKPIWELRKHEIDARSIEQGAITKINGKFLLFLSYETPGMLPRWKITQMCAEHPSQFNAAGMKPIQWDLNAIQRFSVKDPVVYFENDIIYLYIDYFRLTKPHESTAVLISKNGKNFSWNGDIFENRSDCKWATHLIRLTSIIHDDKQYIAYFDGTNTLKDICDEKGGIAIGDNLLSFKIRNTDKPIFYNNYGKGSVRYLFALKHGNSIKVYYEHTEKKGEHALRMVELKPLT